MSVLYTAFSFQHKRALELNTRGRWLHSNCEDTGPLLKELGTQVSVKLLTEKAVMESIADTEEAHLELPELYPIPMSPTGWPWKGILAWVSEVNNAPIYLVTGENYIKPWGTEQGWELETVFGAAGSPRGFVPCPPENTYSRREMPDDWEIEPQHFSHAEMVALGALLEHGGA